MNLSPLETEIARSRETQLLNTARYYSDFFPVLNENRRQLLKALQTPGSANDLWKLTSALIDLAEFTARLCRLPLGSKDSTAGFAGEYQDNSAQAQIIRESELILREESALRASPVNRPVDSSPIASASQASPVNSPVNSLVHLAESIPIPAPRRRGRPPKLPVIDIPVD